MVTAGFANSSNRVLLDSLNNLSYDLSSNYPDSALKLAEQAYSLALENQDTNNQIVACYRMGWVHYKQGDFVKALNEFNLGEDLFKEKGRDSIYLAKIFVYQAMTKRKMGDVDFALFKYGQAISIAIKKKDNYLITDCANNMSDLFVAQDNYILAFDLLNTVLEKLDTTNSRSRGMIHQSLGNIYYNQGRFFKALEAYHISKSYLSNNEYTLSKIFIGIGNTHLSLDDQDSALYYYSAAFEKASRNGYSSLIGIVSQNKGEIFFQRSNYDSAMFYFEKSLRNQEINGNELAQALTHERIGDIFRFKKMQKEALIHYNESFRISQNAGAVNDLKDLSHNLGTLYSDLGNLDSAAFYFNKAKCYHDTIDNRISKSLIYELNYNEERHKVEALQLELQNKNLVLSKRTSLIWSVTIIALCIIFLLFVLIRLNQQKRKSIEIEKRNIQKEKEISDLINLQEQKALKAMFNGQEIEKNRIAMELHDKLGAILSTVKLYFKSIDKQINHLKEENINQYHKANTLLDEACDETRKIAHQLSSKSLGRLGLFETVRKFQNQINDSDQIKFELITHGSDELLGELNQISIYRIIQELVNNILKHALTKEIVLQLNVFEKQVFNLVIEDDGVGFNINQMIDNSGMGLREIESRVNTMNGSVSIDSGKGAGTTITIDIPLIKEKNDKSTIGG